MATIDLGKISFVWKGTYAGGTAYTPKDVVYYNGASYICILASTGNAPTNATYFTKMADGGDTATTLTTQGDILYRNDSGLARLGAGTSGQFLKTQGSGANPVWADNVAGLVQTQFASSNSGYQNGSTTYSTMVNATITPTSASNKIIVLANTTGYYAQQNANGTDRNHYFRILRTVGGTATEVIQAEQRSDTQTFTFVPDNTSLFDRDEPNTTSAVQYDFQMKGQGGAWDYYTNHNSTHASQIILMEVSV